jgi:hypothetical protein
MSTIFKDIEQSAKTATLAILGLVLLGALPIGAAIYLLGGLYTLVLALLALAVTTTVCFFIIRALW